MEHKDFYQLRNACFELVKTELQARYNGEMMEDYMTLWAKHRILPSAELVVETYMGIIGYHKWLKRENIEPRFFVQDALHDLAESRFFLRDDGYSPRTHQYIEFYTE